MSSGGHWPPPWPALGCFPVFSATIKARPHLYPPAPLWWPPGWPFCSHYLFHLNTPSLPMLSWLPATPHSGPVFMASQPRSLPLSLLCPLALLTLS